MAIKVNGTTVIDDSRNLVNIVSGAGASTDLGAVGTYAFFTLDLIITEGNTTSGSNLRYTCHSPGIATGSYATGTWRAMGRNGRTGFADATVFVRIS